MGASFVFLILTVRLLAPDCSGPDLHGGLVRLLDPDCLGRVCLIHTKSTCLLSKIVNVLILKKDNVLILKRTKS